MGMLASCSENDNPGKEDVSQKADLVVFGKIFTSEGNQVVEAFAVKDGKYVYVGDKAGAEALVDRRTSNPRAGPNSPNHQLCQADVHRRREGQYQNWQICRLPPR